MCVCVSSHTLSFPRLTHPNTPLLGYVRGNFVQWMMVFSPNHSLMRAVVSRVVAAVNAHEGEVLPSDVHRLTGPGAFSEALAVWSGYPRTVLWDGDDGVLHEAAADDDVPLPPRASSVRIYGTDFGPSLFAGVLPTWSVGGWLRSAVFKTSCAREIYVGSGDGGDNDDRGGSGGGGGGGGGGNKYWKTQGEVDF